MEASKKSAKIIQPTIFNVEGPKERNTEQAKKPKAKKPKAKKPKAKAKKPKAKAKKPEKKNRVITVTFGDSGENHVGNQQIGTKVSIGEGFTFEDFKKVEKKCNKLKIKCEIINLKSLLKKEHFDKAKTENKVISDAYIILIHDAVQTNPGEDADQIYEELMGFEWDTKYYDSRRKKVLNKHARSNLCFDQADQEPDYEQGKGRIISWDRLPKLSKVKTFIAQLFGAKARDMIGEGNNYSDRTKNGIGWHGDAERMKVIALRINERNDEEETGTMVICWNWFHQSKPLGETLRVEIPHGCIYAMSEKATGFDWKYRSRYTLRHSAGANKYTKL